MSNTQPGYDEAKTMLKRESENIAFLIGNGINLADQGASGISWDDLIKELLNTARTDASSVKCIKNLEFLSGVNGHERRGASLPEFFDIIDTVHIRSTKKKDLQAQICDLLKSMRPGISHRSLVRWAMAKNVPILTTNYDHCLQEASSKPCKRNIFGRGKPMSDYYPWDRYYAPEAISDPLESFAVWHIHGDQALKRSIRTGLDQYMGMVARLRSLKNAIAKEALVGLGPEGDKPPQFHQAPWMRIFMGKKLWIQGLGLYPDEVCLRWLLIERCRYRKKYRPDESDCSGWYVHGPTDNPKVNRLDDARRAFIQALGLQVIEIKNQQDLYENLFGPLNSPRNDADANI